MSVCSHLPSACTGDYSSVYLALEERRVSGSVPSELGALSTVLDLNLRLNVLSGTMPAELWQLTSLTNNLQLWENRISGTISSEASRLSQLKGLYLEVNSLSGTIPTQLALLSASLTHNLGLCCNCGRHWERPCEPSGTGLSGTIPTELGYLSKIGYQTGERDLDLGLNRLSGTVPTELGQPTHATNLWLQQNSLSGTIPAELQALSKLQVLAMESNRFSGTIPPLASLRLLSYCSLNSLAAPVCPAVGQRLPPVCYDHVLPLDCSTPPRFSVVPYVRERVLSPVGVITAALALLAAVVLVVRWFRRRDTGGPLLV